MPNLTALSYLLLALIALMGIAGLWAEAAYPWWRVAFAGYVAGLTYEWVRVRSLRLSAWTAPETRLLLGRSAVVPVHFRSEEPRMLRLRYAADLPEAFAASREARQLILGADESRSVEVPLRPLALGAHRWSRLAMLVEGPLSLAAWRHTVAVDGRLQVVPDILGTAGRSLAHHRAGLVASRRTGGGMELDHLREYRAGDPRHTIDWKATARSGNLVTRVFGEDQHLEIMLVLDVGRTSRTMIDGLNQLGHYVNFAARFAQRIVANEDQVGMIAAADRPAAVVAPMRGQRAVVRIRSELATLAPRAVESDLLSAAVELGRVVRHRCLIVVLTDLHGNAADGRLMQSVRLWAPRHLVVLVGLVGAELKAMGRRPARDWLDPYTSLAAGVYRRDLDRSIQGFRRLGAQALLAQPRDLEQLVVSRYQTLRGQRRV